MAILARMLHAAATCLFFCADVSSAARPAARPFENSLRRAVAVYGQEQARFALADRMEHYRVPGVSVAVIENCRIVDARGFGTSAGAGPAITPHTLFQAGSISKTVTAVAALKLVEQRKLELDQDVRPLVKGWNVQDRPAFASSPLTLRMLLNHTAGLNAVGGKGYERGAPLPTLVDILNGASTANTPPIRVERAPGSGWVYSSGGYYVAQALITDSSGEPFPRLVGRLVFKPAGMRESSFSQPLDARASRLAARAAGADGAPLPGGWRANPELGAGGLWSTPSDLARLLIAVATDLRDGTTRLLSRESYREMLTPTSKNWGLGVELGEVGGPRRIGHTGHNVGFVSEYLMYPDSCQGAVVMTNADQGGWLVREILRAIADVYRWPEPRPSPVKRSVPLTEAIAARFVGTYRLRDFPDEKFTISRKSGGGLYWARVGHIGRDVLAAGDGVLFSPDGEMTLEAVSPAAALAASLTVRFGAANNIADRVE